jgi:opine dehydrogenase
MPHAVAVLGGGHGALAAAGDLARRGFEVRLAVRNRGRFAELFETRRVRLEGVVEDEGEVALVTDDHARAAEGADILLVAAPASIQVDILARALPALRADQVVCFAAGTFSCWPAAELLRRRGAAQPLLAEVATLPYGARTSGSASVRLALEAKHLPTGVYPARRTDDALAALGELYPVVEPAEDALAGGLLNFDGALHAPLTLLNAGAIEGLPEFDVHVQGATPAVVRVSLALDEERIALREALGYRSHHWPLRDYYEGREMFYGVAYRQTREQSVWREKLDFEHRYVTEDIALGLVLWASLGRRLGVPTPLSDAFVHIASTINGVDYLRHGRTLENLGLGDVPIETLQEWLRHGRPA